MAETVPNTKNSDQFCYDLPSKFQPDIGLILVTGASGYIGGRLVPELMARGYRVRVMVRAESPEYALRWPGAEIIVADALDPKALAIALNGVDTAYYLLHSLQLGPRKFEGVDLEAAGNFCVAAEQQQVKRIIYLGGLGDVRNPLSSHLCSRMAIADQLRQGRTPVTILRAAIIIGSGSASYEIIYYLVKKLPLIFLPDWAANKCQLKPISYKESLVRAISRLEQDSVSTRWSDAYPPAHE
ncbi:MAG: NAD(P)H-binding protein, partial [Candidatus Omnitrophica bacterium]|nr:NAD(P)H-binding protein [Candidatus Omnitrophota bacterium]